MKMSFSFKALVPRSHASPPAKVAPALPAPPKAGQELSTADMYRQFGPRVARAMARSRREPQEPASLEPSKRHSPALLQ